MRIASLNKQMPLTLTDVPKEPLSGVRDTVDAETAAVPSPAALPYAGSSPPVNRQWADVEDLRESASRKRQFEIGYSNTASDPTLTAAKGQMPARGMGYLERQVLGMLPEEEMRLVQTGAQAGAALRDKAARTMGRA